MSAVATRRAAFATTAAVTATPQALLVMLYDRLVLDLQRAEAAQRAGDHPSAHTQLLHAQDIVAELQLALDPSAWDGAKGLDALYTWLLTELVGANTTRDADRTAACREVVQPLCEAWREASALACAPRTVAVGGTA